MLWFKSNVQHLIPSEKYLIESFANGLIHRLTILNVQLRDEGEYTASTGLNTSQAKLTVESFMPVFIVPLMDARATTTETVKLSCETSNACQVVWTHRGKKIIENSYKYTLGKRISHWNGLFIRISSVHLGNFNNSTLHTLDIDNLELRDQGEVLCSIAQHPTVSTTCQLLVEEASEQCKTSCLSSFGSINAHRPISAVFAAPLKPFVEVVRGQDAVLNCETFDSTYFQWLKDGTTLMATSNKVRTLGDDKHSTLIISQFNDYDEGN